MRSTWIQFETSKLRSLIVFHMYPTIRRVFSLLVTFRPTIKLNINRFVHSSLFTQKEVLSKNRDTSVKFLTNINTTNHYFEQYNSILSLLLIASPYSAFSQINIWLSILASNKTNSYSWECLRTLLIGIAWGAAQYWGSLQCAMIYLKREEIPISFPFKFLSEKGLLLFLRWNCLRFARQIRVSVRVLRNRCNRFVTERNWRKLPLNSLFDTFSCGFLSDGDL